MIKVVYFILFIAICQGINSLNKPIFESEIISFEIDSTKCTVRAEYYFRNADISEIINQVLFYPFPINEYTPFPESIDVISPENHQMDYSQVSNGIFFKVSIPSDSTVCYVVNYTQMLNINKFEYILTSTQKWGRPLSSATFNIYHDPNLELKSLSYKPDSTYIDSNKQVIRISKKQFLPIKNLIIEW
ncbi:MAG: hypothetical protein HQ509_09470 [Candidatus Marinimicrobia bacterium]|nr:hypothetical protein [Candidatus Neomarinimicrobiota bacterium]